MVWAAALLHKTIISGFFNGLLNFNKFNKLYIKKMKKILMVSIVCLAVGLVLTGCSNSQTNANQNDGANANNTQVNQIGAGNPGDDAGGPPPDDMGGNPPADAGDGAGAPAGDNSGGAPGQ